MAAAVCGGGGADLAPKRAEGRCCCSSSNSSDKNNERPSVCVWESAGWGLASWFSNWRLKWPFIFPYSISAGFFERSVTFLANLFFFLPTLLFALDEKDVGPSTCCYLILAMRFHCVGFVCTRALTAMFALSVFNTETRLSSSPSRLSLMETRSFHGDRESVTVNSPALSRADQINTGPRNRPMRMWMKNTNKKKKKTITKQTSPFRFFSSDDLWRDERQRRE